MGTRIVVTFQDDMAHEWGSDPDLGKKILLLANWHSNPTSKFYPHEMLEGVRIAEHCDASIQTLAAFDGYTMHTLALQDRRRGEPKAQFIFRLLKDALRNMGYKVYRNPFRRR